MKTFIQYYYIVFIAFISLMCINSLAAATINNNNNTVNTDSLILVSFNRVKNFALQKQNIQSSFSIQLFSDKINTELKNRYISTYIKEYANLDYNSYILSDKKRTASLENYFLKNHKSTTRLVVFCMDITEYYNTGLVIRGDNETFISKFSLSLLNKNSELNNNKQLLQSNNIKLVSSIYQDKNNYYLFAVLAY
jgi:hypothetical protein